MPKALVTGGCGFIGSHLVEGLINAGFSVRVLDNLSKGKEENLGSLREICDVRIGSITDEKAVNDALEGIRTVFHFAALSAIAPMESAPLLGHEINVSATLRLMTTAAELGIERFLFASSSAVYGERHSYPKRESDPRLPCSIYGVTKASCEEYARVLANSEPGMSYVMLRFFNPFGPRQSVESAAAVASFLDCLATDQPITIYGDGTQTRDFIYVKDAVDLCLTLAHTPYSPPFQAVNVGTGKQTSIQELAELTMLVTGKTPPLNFAPERRGDLRFSCADMSYAESQYGFRPKTSLEEGLRRAWEWKYNAGI